MLSCMDNADIVTCKRLPLQAASHMPNIKRKSCANSSLALVQIPAYPPAYKHIPKSKLSLVLLKLQSAAPFDFRQHTGGNSHLGPKLHAEGSTLKHLTT